MPRNSTFQPKASWNRLKRKSSLKSGKAMKHGKRLRPLGKKGRAWGDARDELKVEFAAIGVTACELRYENCANDDYLGFAHAAKRRKLTPEDLKHVILACNFCHDTLEVLPPEKMKRIVDETIRNRASLAANSL